MITDNENKLSYLFKEYLGQEVIVAASGQELPSAAEKLKTQVCDLLERDGYLSNKNKLDTSKTVKLSIDIALLLSEIVFSDSGVLPEKKHYFISDLQNNAKGNSKNLEAALDQVSEQFLYVDNLTLIKASKQVLLKDKCLDVTPNEFNLLLLLINKGGANVSKEVLSQKGIGKKFRANDRTVDVHISNLRKKLGIDSKDRERIKTVRGLGYQYVIYPDA